MLKYIYKIEKIFKTIYNKIIKEHNQTQETQFGPWYRQSELFKKVNLTTSAEEINKLFDKEINYYG